MTKWHEIMKTVAIGIKVILRVMPGSFVPSLIPYFTVSSPIVCWHG
jgi:hypothetical protein